MPTEPTPEQVDEVKVLLAGGNKIEAIKVFREMTGSGLAEAKQAVERLEASGSLDVGSSLPGKDDRMNEIRDLLRRRKKIDAIKVYRESTGSGLKEAKEAVEEMEASMGLPKSSAGCGAMIALMLLGGFAIAAVTLIS